MRIRITLAQLEAFVSVASTLSFRAAAQTLHVSQPALSRTIKLAEQALGTRLFDRSTQHVGLTPAGHELLPIAARILDNFNSSFSELAQFLEGRSGTVTIAALPSTGAAIVPNVIARFRERHPLVEFSLLENQAEVLSTLIDEGRADLGITVRPRPDQRLDYRHLLDDPFVLLCRRDDPLAARSTVNWTAFTTRPFISADYKSSIRPITDAAFLRQGLRVTPAIEYPSIAAAGALVSAGLGLSALPLLAMHLVNTDHLVGVPLRRPTMSRPVGVVTRMGRSLSPVAKQFIDFLVAETLAGVADHTVVARPAGPEA
ncbi:LysR family transcriptional regulator [Variovorax saccharolyticus]|uniref:LysR family transcriptional regulator n=1 Tax=Variovorax saccharolyticus TaxID=3053516 RepID=UPI002576BB59|nr:LysR family transcriptional regulator [Variovorax sp. J22R187]MDM0022213.1 LysR family transcriptional regulator [Variovorax sp. J22R187]